MRSFHGLTVAEFLAAVENGESRQVYASRLRWVARDLGVAVDSLLGLEGEALTSSLLEWVKKRRSSLSGTSVYGVVGTVRKWLTFEGVEGRVRWAKVRMAMPKPRFVGSDRAPTLEEVRGLMEVCDLRLKVVVSCMVSGGFRLGSWRWLRVGDLSPVEEDGLRLGRLVIYRGEPDSSVAF